MIEPEIGVAVTLDDCEELAREERVDKWALAARFAHRMLPQVFRPGHPVFDVQFTREYRLKLEGLVEGLPAEVFTATDALGWVYQFWQAKKKDEVNRSEVKIGADELPAVTQLFTEPYIVQFLLHNSLGSMVGQSSSRHKACPVDLTYLRRTEDGAPAAGAFDGWPDNLSQFRLLDPCCGSGHFLMASVSDAGAYAYGARGSEPSRSCGCRTAAKHSWAGARPALCRDCGVRPSPRGMALPGCRRVFGHCRSSTSPGVDNRLPARKSSGWHWPKVTPGWRPA